MKAIQTPNNDSSSHANSNQWDLHLVGLILILKSIRFSTLASKSIWNCQPIWNRNFLKPTKSLKEWYMQSNMENDIMQKKTALSIILIWNKENCPSKNMPVNLKGHIIYVNWTRHLISITFSTVCDRAYWRIWRRNAKICLKHFGKQSMLCAW